MSTLPWNRANLWQSWESPEWQDHAAESPGSTRQADRWSDPVKWKKSGRSERKEIAAFRRENLGFVFQDFNLLDTFSLKDNIFLPLVLEGKRYREMKQKADPIVRKLGISNLLEKYPHEVSGGQKQRAAVARALITDPQLVLADEPSGALDSHAADALMQLFEEINQEGQTIVMVTHSVKRHVPQNGFCLSRTEKSFISCTGEIWDGMRCIRRSRIR